MVVPVLSLLSASTVAAIVTAAVEAVMANISAVTPIVNVAAMTDRIVTIFRKHLDDANWHFLSILVSFMLSPTG